MARKKTLRAPTTSSLPNDLRIPSNTPSVVKALSRLSRQSLLDVVLIWLSASVVKHNPPFLGHDTTSLLDDLDASSPYPPANSVQDVRDAYEELGQRKGGKREVIDRILEGDWRHGLTLRQLAMVDIRYLEDHPRAQTWSAFRLHSVDNNKRQSGGIHAEHDDLQASLPRLHTATFMSNLQREISPLVKAHYHLARSKTYPATYLRVFVSDSPYQQPRHATGAYLDSARIVYIVFPDSSPFVYTSMTASTSTKVSSAQGTAPLMSDPRTLRGIVRDALPKALSKPHERYKLEATSLTAKSLKTMLALRGNGRTNEANGVFSIFADAVLEGTPIDPRNPTTVPPEDYRGYHDKENNVDQHELKRTIQTAQTETTCSPAMKRRKLAVMSRFGTSGTASSQATLNQLDIRLLDRPDDENQTASDDENSDDEHRVNSGYAMSLSFTGNNVIAGFRRLAELGVVDPTRMPSWMTGEEGVSSAVIRRGKRVGKGAVR